MTGTVCARGENRQRNTLLALKRQSQCVDCGYVSEREIRQTDITQVGGEAS